MFNVCDKKFNIKNINLIHPRKQRIVYNIAKSMKGICDYIIVFGSSVRWDCNEYSDLDVAVLKDSKLLDKKALYDVLMKETNSNFDLLEINNEITELSELQRRNVIERGVRIYARV